MNTIYIAVPVEKELPKIPKNNTLIIIDAEGEMETIDYHGKDQLRYLNVTHWLKPCNSLKELMGASLEIKEEIIKMMDWYEKLPPAKRVSVWSKNGEHNGLFNMDNEQLLGRYIEDKFR